MTVSHASLTVLPALCAAVGALFLSCSARSQESSGVALQFLQRHGVPCRLVLMVGHDEFGEAALCEDGRIWALFWAENEIAFVHPQTREAYKWDRQIYLCHPELYFARDPNIEYTQSIMGR